MSIRIHESNESKRPNELWMYEINKYNWKTCFCWWCWIRNFFFFCFHLKRINFVLKEHTDWLCWLVGRRIKSTNQASRQASLASNCERKIANASTASLIAISNCIQFKKTRTYAPPPSPKNPKHKNEHAFFHLLKRTEAKGNFSGCVVLLVMVAVVVMVVRWWIPFILDVQHYSSEN